MRVIVLGAAGLLGREVVREVGARGHEVTVFVRRPPTLAFDKGVRIETGDAHDLPSVSRVIEGHDAVVNAIGSGTLRYNDVESSTTAIAVNAARNLGVRRYIAMSAGMVALEPPISLLFRFVLRPLLLEHTYAEHLRVEAIVRASTLLWTIVRPPRLTMRPARGYIASLERQKGSVSVSRADVAAFIATEIEKNEYVCRAAFIASRRVSPR
jgi:putative NADH-flavin reductase